MAEQLNTHQDLLRHSMEKIHFFEAKLAEELPKAAEMVTSPVVRQAIHDHAVQTKDQESRIDSCMTELYGRTEKIEDIAFMALWEEEQKALSQAGPEAKDILLVAGAAKVEHYEMAAYEAACDAAMACGKSDVAKVLEQNMGEEIVTAKKLGTLAGVLLAPMIG